MRSHWIRLGPIPMTGALIRRGKLEHRDTDTEERQPWDDGGRGWSYAATSQAKPRLLGTTRSWKRQGRILPQKLWRKHGLSTPWFQTSSLQKCEIISFCCFKPPSLQHFLTEALGLPLNFLQHTGQPTTAMNYTVRLLVVSRLRKSAEELKSVTLIKHFIIYALRQFLCLEFFFFYLILIRYLTFCAFVCQYIH